MKRTLVTVGFFAALVAAWQICVSTGELSAVILPSPLSVARYLWNAIADGTLLGAAAVTARRLVLGYAIGLAIGLPFGFATARWRVVQDTLGVLALGLQTLPSVCWVPLALLWFGQSESAMLFVTVLGTVWSIQLATQQGISTVPPIYLRAARTMGSKGFHTLWRVTMPAALPSIVTGMKQGWAFAWRSLMAAEIYVTVLSGLGLGHLLHYGRELHAMDQVLGVMLAIVAIGLLVDVLLFGPVQRSLHRRWGTG